MFKLPLIVKGRDSSGKMHEVHCGTLQLAEEILAEFRKMHSEVWIEDAEGEKIEDSGDA
jgi:hypothetical protein